MIFISILFFFFNLYFPISTVNKNHFDNTGLTKKFVQLFPYKIMNFLANPIHSKITSNGKVEM